MTAMRNANAIALGWGREETVSYRDVLFSRVNDFLIGRIAVDSRSWAAAKTGSRENGTHADSLCLTCVRVNQFT